MTPLIKITQNNRPALKHQLRNYFLVFANWFDGLAKPVHKSID